MKNIYYHPSLNSTKNEKCFRQKFVEKIKTHTFMFNNDFSFEKRANAEKYFTAEQATDDNMAHVHFMLRT